MFGTTIKHKRNIKGTLPIVILCTMLSSLSLLSSACLRPVSVERCGYVVAIGMDGGKEKAYEITLELQRESAGEAQDGGGSIILSCEARDLFEAVSELSSNTAYDLNFTRTHLFIVGEKLARECRLDDMLNMSFDVLRIRKSALMVVARCPVRDYIGGLASNKSANIAKMQDALISNVETTGETAAINLSLFIESLNGGRFDAVMPMGDYDDGIITDMKQRDSAQKGENPISGAEKGARIGGMQGLTRGCALFDGGKMCGELSPAETQLMNLVRGDYKRGTIAYPLENGETASLLVFPNKRKISVDLGGDAPRAKVELRLNVTIERDPTRNIGENWETKEREKLESFFEAKLGKVFEKCRELNSDAMGFGRYASMNFRSTADWEAFSWKSEYGSLGAEFTVEVNLDDEYLVTSGR
ncbi:MAG: hypothetical protein IKZ82_12240 [Clostridia bacterium]|nr:hypothetical protein [Clostridia bacterium]